MAFTVGSDSEEGPVRRHQENRGMKELLGGLDLYINTSAVR